MDLDWRLTLEEGLVEVDENDIQTSGSIGWYWKWGWDNALDGKSNAMKTVSIDDHKAAAYLRGYHDGLEYLLTKASLQE